MDFLENALNEIVTESDVPFGSPLYREIAADLTAVGLNLAFFVFRTRSRSPRARRRPGRRRVAGPVLTLYLKHEADLRETGIDRRRDNANDEWPGTRRVREAVNRCFLRHGLGDDYVSEHTFVLVRDRERIVFEHIGRALQGELEDLVVQQVPGVTVQKVSFDAGRYDVILPTAAQCKRVGPEAKAKLDKRMQKLFARADEKRFCQSYPATIAFGHPSAKRRRPMRESP
jgi:hypothetical protein